MTTESTVVSAKSCDAASAFLPKRMDIIVPIVAVGQENARIVVSRADKNTDFKLISKFYYIIINSQTSML